MPQNSSKYKPDGLISVTLRGVPGFELISTRRGGLLSTTLDWGRDRGTVLSSLSVWFIINIGIDSSPARPTEATQNSTY